MTIPFKRTIAALGTLAAVGLAAPALAGDQSMPMQQQQAGSGMMGGMGGMMGSGKGMMGGGMKGHGMMGGMGMMGPMAGLELSEEQLQEMTEIHKQGAREHADMMAGMPALRYRLSRELSRDEPDAERVGELFLQMKQQRRELMQGHMQMRQKMMQVLSEEQRDEMQEMMGRGGGMPMQDH